MTYPTIPGVDPERCTVANALATAGVVHPDLNLPFTESWVLGLGGGLGSTYMLWEFQARSQITIVLAFGYRANYPKESLTHAVARCGGEIEILETGSRKKAWTNLRESLDQGRVPICTVDPALLPHLQMPPGVDGCYGWVVNATAIDDSAETVAIHDVGTHTRSVPMETLERARSRVGSYKNRLARVVPSRVLPNLGKSIGESIGACCDYLGSASDSFGLRSIRKWARLMTDTKHAKGWPQVFARGRGLFGGLASVYQGIQHDAGGGGALRDLYATFLREAGSLLNRAEFAAAADAYDKCARAWHRVAEASLPAEDFAEARSEFDRRYELIRTGTNDDAAECRALTASMDARATSLNAKFPLDETGRNELLQSIQHALSELYEREVAALSLLQSCR